MKVIINQKAVNRIKKRHPWIFRSDLKKDIPEIAGPVDVVCSNGKLWGQALYSPKSQIALRMMTKGAEKITPELLKKRILAAANFRKKIGICDPMHRMVFAESDQLPSLIVDRFNDCFVFQTLSAGMEVYKKNIIQILNQEFRPRTIIEKNTSTVRLKEDLPMIQQIVHGEDPTKILIDFHRIKLAVQPLDGQKTGFFLDQRYNATRTSKYLYGNILDCFCHHGQFSLHATAHTKSITCIDSSDFALKQLETNCKLNQINNIETVQANVFDYLKAKDQEGAKFDGIILDPPAFAKSRSHLQNASRAYKEINLRAMRLLKHLGILATFSCSQNFSKEEFCKVLRSASADARVGLKVLEEFSQPADHPWLLQIPETYYLKGYLIMIHRD